jgi:signal transduction histidine kinase
VRRSLIVTVAAAVTMVLLAMLVPMAVLLRDYALEDRLSRAALEVQATEAVVSRSDRDLGDVEQYVGRLNDGEGVRTTVLYPDGIGVGPDPGEDHRVVEARNTSRARIDDAEGGGAEFLVPVSLGGSSAGASDTPVIRVVVEPPGLESGIVRSLVVLLLLGLALLAGALVLADRLGRSFVQPVRALASYAGQLGSGRRPSAPPPDGPPEVRELATALDRLVDRIEVLLERERAGVADLSHRLRTPVTALRLGIEGLADVDERERLGGDLDRLEGMVDHVVREARRSEREGLVASSHALAAIAERAAFWGPLAEDQGRTLEVSVATGEGRVRAADEDVRAVVDVLLDNVFTHTPEGAAVRVSASPAPAGGVVLVVEDDGPGFPAGLDPVDRGSSGAGSTGLGLAIAQQTAAESGGGLVLEASASGGARVVLTLGGA